MREQTFENGEYYHVYNRGVEKRTLFPDDSYFERFLESMYLFNDSLYAHRPDPVHRVSLLASAEVAAPDRDPFVNIISYCLMPNHYHLLLEQRKNGGISRFLHKLDKGYSRFFNLQKQRSGTLYEGTFKAVHVDSDAYLFHLPVYIHLNALDLIGIPWRDGTVIDWESANKFLDTYRWSSHHAYLNRDEYLPITAKEIVNKFYLNNKDYLTHLRNWSSRAFVDNLEMFYSISLPSNDIFAKMRENDVT